MDWLELLDQLGLIKDSQGIAEDDLPGMPDPSQTSILPMWLSSTCVAAK